MHWCAVSSKGNGELAVARWLSILNHLIDVHHHDTPLHPACLHGPLEREWFTPGKHPLHTTRFKCCKIWPSYRWLEILEIIILWDNKSVRAISCFWRTHYGVYVLLFTITYFYSCRIRGLRTTKWCAEQSQTSESHHEVKPRRPDLRSWGIPQHCESLCSQNEPFPVPRNEKQVCFCTFSIVDKMYNMHMYHYEHHKFMN